MSNELTLNTMKRICIIMVLLLTGIVAEAQTSVWDGSRKLWTRGEGTADNPYLIESAEHLAFLSYMVNKNFDTQGLYFRLTTDIDLNGSEGQPWKPIGLYDRGFDEDGCDRGNLNSTGYGPRTMFRGHFDGGGHVISNIYVDNGGGYAGLFGYADSWTDEDVVIENLWVSNGYIHGSTCGGIVGQGSRVVVSYCRNGADIEGSKVGGILGSGGATVHRCSNVGRLTGSDVGGIVGGMSEAAAAVTECFNDGDITASRIGGGILCSSARATIDNCYNTGTVAAVGDSAAFYPVAGGLVGAAMYNGTEVSNSYNVGDVSGNHHVGCLLGYVASPEAVSFENCFYLNDCYDSEYGTSKSAEEMRDEAFVDVLNQGNAVWGFDENNVNDGFPVLVRTNLSVSSHVEKDLTVYPNPTNGMVNIEGVEVAQVQVYNILGQTVRTYNNTNRINVGDLPKGVYLLRITDKEGKTFMENTIKE